MIATVYLPQKDQREYFAARCDTPGCDAETLPHGTQQRAAFEARSRGWEIYINVNGQTGHVCATCRASKENEQ